MLRQAYVHCVQTMFGDCKNGKYHAILSTWFKFALSHSIPDNPNYYLKYSFTG
jgi:hypothetical protein